MKRNYLFALLLGLLSFYTQAQNGWVKKKDVVFPSTYRYGMIAATAGNKAYVGTGADSSQRLQGDIYMLDIPWATWRFYNTFPGTARKNAVAVAVGDKIYMGTGEDSAGYCKDWWELDVSGAIYINGLWTRKADFPAIARSGAVAFVLHNQVYVCAGKSQNGLLRDCWRYNPLNDSWTAADSLPVAREEAVTFSVGPYAYITTGKGASGLLKDCWRYDTLGAKWKAQPPFTGSARWGAVAFSALGKSCIGLGKDSFSFKEDCWSIDTSTGQWQWQYSMPVEGRADASAFNLSGGVYFCAGRNTAAQYDTWRLLPNQNPAWKRKVGFAFRGRESPVSAGLAGKGYVAMGVTGYSQTYSPMWVYDPITDTWQSKTVSFLNEREMGVMISNGTKIYAGLGQYNSITLLRDWWEYDPQTDVWTQKANFGGSVRIRASAFAIGSRVFAGVTGQSSNATPQRDLYEYNPQTNTWTKKADFPGVQKMFQNILFTLNGVAYMGGGYGYDFKLKTDMWMYDPQMDVWTPKADFKNAEQKPICFTWKGRAYALAGYPISTQNELWEFDPLYDEWNKRKAMPTLHRVNAACFVADKPFVGLGYSLVSGEEGYLDDLWEYQGEGLQINKAGLDSICQGDSLLLSFYNNKQRQPGNTFFLQISGPGASFNNPTLLAMLQDTAVKRYTIKVKIPDTLQAGSYLFRLLSNNAADTALSTDMFKVRYKPKALIDASSNSFCFNHHHVQFKDTLLNTSFANTLNWNFGDSSSSTQLQPLKKYAKAGTYTVKLRTEGAKGCFDSTFMQLTIKESPDSRIVVSDTVACINIAPHFALHDSSVANSGTIVLRSWFWGDSSFSTGAHPVKTYNAVGAYNVTFMCANSIGCTDTTRIKLRVVDKPQTVIYATDTLQCLQNNLFKPIDNTTAPGAPIASRTWLWGDNSSTTGTLYPTKTYSSPGIYLLKLALVNEKGCADTASKVLRVKAAPLKPTITQNGFQLSSSAAQAYRWMRNNADIAGATGQTYTVTQNGWYKVRIDSNACSNISDSIGITNVSVNSLTEAANFGVYPNPFSGRFSIKPRTRESYSYRLQDASGRMYLQGKAEGELTLEPLQELPAGVYVLMISSEQHTEQKKLLKY